MKKTIIFLLFFFIACTLSYAKPDAGIGKIEKEQVFNSKYYDEILATQRHNYNINTIVLCAVITFTFVLIGLTWFFNFRAAKSYIHAKLEENRKDFDRKAEEIVNYNKQELKRIEQEIEHNSNISFGNNCFAMAKQFIKTEPGLFVRFNLTAIKYWTKAESKESEIKERFTILYSLIKHYNKKDLEKYMVEYGEILAEIDETKYGGQKKALKEEIEKFT